MSVNNNTAISVLLGLIGMGIIFALLVAPSFAITKTQIIENRITSSGNTTDTTNCINLASQYQLILNSTNGDCYVRALANGTGITIDTNSTHLIINATGGSGESTECSDITSIGETIISSSSGGNCVFKRITSGTGIVVTGNSTNVIITNSLPESTVCSNVGSGNTIHVVGSNCNAKSLIAGTGVGIVDTADDYTFSSSCNNTGTGEAVCESSNNINSLIAGTCITIADTTGDLTITGTCGGNHNLLDGSVHPDTVAQTVSKGSLIYGDSTPKWSELVAGSAGQYLYINEAGLPIWEHGDLRFISATGQTLTLSDTLVDCKTTGGAGDITINLPASPSNVDKRYLISKVQSSGINEDCIIDASGSETINGELTYKLENNNQWVLLASGDSTSGGWIIRSVSSPQLVVSVFASKTMTNIGTTNVDIYTTAFDMEDLAVIDCNGIIGFRIVWMWDYAGTGTQTVRWVDASNNANVLYSTTTLVDADALDSGWVDKPSWCTGIKTIEQQGSSTTAGDDPVAKGYVIFVR